MDSRQYGEQRRDYRTRVTEIGDKNGDRESGRVMELQQGLKLKKKSKTRTKMDRGQDGEQIEY